MNKFSLITQIGMILVSSTIVVMYIQPKISTIRETQDAITNYERETQNVSQINETLKTKISEIEAIAPQDVAALNRFLPNQVDEISVLKDLSTIISSQSILPFDVVYNGNTVGKTAETGTPSEYGDVSEYYFSATFETSYNQLKNLLGIIETNAYLLQITNLKITDSGSGQLKVSMSITAFSRKLEVPNVTS